MPGLDSTGGTDNKFDALPLLLKYIKELIRNAAARMDIFGS